MGAQPQKVEDLAPAYMLVVTIKFLITYPSVFLFLFTTILIMFYLRNLRRVLKISYLTEMSSKLAFPKINLVTMKLKS
jgi:hypothetical protein